MNNEYEGNSFKEKFGLYRLYDIMCHRTLFL